MRNVAYPALAGAVLMLAGAAPAQGQMWFVPDYALPSATDGQLRSFGATYARGLNDASGQFDAIGIVGASANGTISLMGSAGMVLTEGDDEFTGGFSIGADVMQGETATIGIQGGIGWMSPGETTWLRFPIGVSVKGSFESPEAVITPWAMPRLNIARLSGGGESQTETDFGASGGVDFRFNGGFGAHAAIDGWFGDGDTAWLFGAGVSYYF